MKKSVTNEKLEFYRAMLPYGTIKIVAERAGVTGQAVTNFLNGRNGSYRIENTILDIIAELQAERKERLKKAGILYE